MHKIFLLYSKTSILRISVPDGYASFNDAFRGRNNAITIFAFASNNDNKLENVPFSFNAGYGIAFNSGLISIQNYFEIIGTDGIKIESIRLYITS